MLTARSNYCSGVKFFRPRTSSSCQLCPRCSYASRRPPPQAARHKQLTVSRRPSTSSCCSYLLERPPVETHLLLHLLLDLLQVGPQVHVDRMFGAQQSLQHGVGRHTHSLQSGFLHAGQVDHFDLQVLDLMEAIFIFRLKPTLRPSSTHCWHKYSLEHQTWSNPLLKTVPNKSSCLFDVNYSEQQLNVKLNICQVFLFFYFLQIYVFRQEITHPGL